MCWLACLWGNEWLSVGQVWDRSEGGKEGWWRKRRQMALFAWHETLKTLKHKKNTKVHINNTNPNSMSHCHKRALHLCHPDTQYILFMLFVLHLWISTFTASCLPWIWSEPSDVLYVCGQVKRLISIYSLYYKQSLVKELLSLIAH